MNPHAIQDLARRGVETGNCVQGIRVQFRGKEIRVRVSQDAPTLDLTPGGFSPKQLWKIRFSSRIQPPPSEGEKVKNLRTGKTYVVTGVIPADDNSSCAEHMATATWQ